MKTCVFKDCDRNAKCKNYCDMHYRRLLKRGSADDSGSRKKDTGDEIQRFNKKYEIDEISGCWNWIGSKRANSKGVNYGRHFINKGKSIGAHRFSYQYYVGEIKKGNYICHHCDNPLCVNPLHLFQGTHKDNMKDMVIKNRADKSRGEDKKALAKLTNIQADEIRKLQISQSKIAKIYNVSQTTIGRIKRKESY